MIFKVEKGKDFFEMNPEVEAFEKMSKCTSRELKWICLVYDYQTPLRNIPIEERKTTAAKMAGFRSEWDGSRLDKNARDTVNGKLQKVNEAVEEFMGIQYDEENELLQAYREQISQAVELLKKKNKSEKEWSIADKLIKTIPSLLSAKKELEKSLGMREEKEDSEFDDTLSSLDMFHEQD